MKTEKELKNNIKDFEKFIKRLKKRLKHHATKKNGDCLWLGWGHFEMYIDRQATEEVRNMKVSRPGDKDE